MSRYFLIVLLFLFSVSLKAQSYFDTHSSDLKDSAVNVYIPPPAKVLSNLQKAINPHNPFRLTFVGVETVDYPAGAKAAADFATNLISSYINFNSLASGDSIRIKVVWQEIASTNTKLASTLTSKNLLLQNNVSYLYPTPLAEKLNNGNMNGTEYDATITVYKINGIQRYYFGTDGQCPSTQIDFVTIFLHEITHALGFGSSIYLYNGDATFGFDSLGNVKANGVRGFPMFYDTFVVDSNAFKTKLIEDTQYNFTNYIKSDKIYFESTNSKLFNKNGIVKLHTNSNNSDFNIIAHLNEVTFRTGDINSLMTPTFHLQEAVHQIGPIAWGMLKDLGWDMNSSIFITEPTKSFNTIYLASDPLLVEWLDTYENGSIVTNISLFVNGVSGDSLIMDTSQTIYT